MASPTESESQRGASGAQCWRGLRLHGSVLALRAISTQVAELASGLDPNTPLSQLGDDVALEAFKDG